MEKKIYEYYLSKRQIIMNASDVDSVEWKWRVQTSRSGLFANSATFFLPSRPSPISLFPFRCLQPSQAAAAARLVSSPPLHPARSAAPPLLAFAALLPLASRHHSADLCRPSARDTCPAVPRSPAECRLSRPTQSSLAAAALISVPPPVSPPRSVPFAQHALVSPPECCSLQRLPLCLSLGQRFLQQFGRCLVYLAVQSLDSHENPLLVTG